LYGSEKKQALPEKLPSIIDGLGLKSGAIMRGKIEVSVFLSADRQGL
jgi:hypothetical protein